MFIYERRRHIIIIILPPALSMVLLCIFISHRWNENVWNCFKCPQSAKHDNMCNNHHRRCDTKKRGEDDKKSKSRKSQEEGKN
jgi:hypothetical protein